MLPFSAIVAATQLTQAWQLSDLAIRTSSAVWLVTGLMFVMLLLTALETYLCRQRTN